MRFVLAHVAMAWGGATGAAHAQEAAGTLDKIQSTGKVVMGVREARRPAMPSTMQKYVGYHVEQARRCWPRSCPRPRSSTWP